MDPRAVEVISVASRHRNVDVVAGTCEPPASGRGGVTEHRVVSTGKQGGHLQCPGRSYRMAHQVDASMDAVKATVRPPARDRTGTESDVEKLRPRDHPELTRRDARDRASNTGGHNCGHLTPTPTCPQKCPPGEHFARHVPSRRTCTELSAHRKTRSQHPATATPHPPSMQAVHKRAHHLRASATKVALISRRRPPRPGRARPQRRRPRSTAHRGRPGPCPLPEPRSGRARPAPGAC